MTIAAPLFTEIPPHRQLNGFLGEELVERLLLHASVRQSEFEQSGVGGNRTEGRVDPQTRQSLMLWDLGELRPVLAERFAAILPWAVSELRLAPITLAKLELQLVAHGDGAFYGEHIDTGTGPSDRQTQRALTAVYYFHRQPKHYTGGALRLLALAPGADGIRRFTDIVPDNDMLLLFPSWVPHEVRPVHCPSGDFMDSRFAINCWFRQARGR